MSASVRPRSGPAVSIPRACRRSWSQPPTKAGRAATAAVSAATKSTMASTGGWTPAPRKPAIAAAAPATTTASCS